MPYNLLLLNAYYHNFLKLLKELNKIKIKFKFYLFRRKIFCQKLLSKKSFFQKNDNFHLWYGELCELENEKLFMVKKKKTKKRVLINQNYF
jgi:hypothetical protein